LLESIEQYGVSKLCLNHGVVEFLNDVKCSESWQVEILHFRMKIAGWFYPLLSEDI
jgi:hypothetical protein